MIRTTILSFILEIRDHAQLVGWAAVAAQRSGGGDAENEIEPLGAEEIQDFGRAIMAIGAEQDVHARPVSANGADQAAQKAAHLAPGGAAGGALILLIKDIII